MAPKRAASFVAKAAKAKAAPSGGAATSSSSSGNQRPATFAELAQTGSERATEVTTNIEDLIQEQKDLRASRRKLAADLRNARRKKARLQQRARTLSTEDLLTVVALREEQAAQAAVARASQEEEPQTLPGEPLAASDDPTEEPLDREDHILNDAVRSPV